MTVALVSLDDLEQVITRLLDDRPRPLVVDRKGACRLLAVSDSTLGRLVREGVITPVPHLRPARYSIAQLTELVTASASTPAATPRPAAGVDGPADADSATTSGGSGSDVLPLSARRGDRRGPQSTARRGRTPGDAA